MDSHRLLIEFEADIRLNLRAGGSVELSGASDLEGRLSLEPVGAEEPEREGTHFRATFVFANKGVCYRYEGLVTPWDLRFRDRAMIALNWPQFLPNVPSISAGMALVRPAFYFLPNGDRCQVEAGVHQWRFDVMIEPRYAVIRCTIQTGHRMNGSSPVLFYVRQYPDLLFLPSDRLLFDPYGVLCGFDDTAERIVDLAVLD